MDLSQAKSGELVRVKEILGGQRAVTRLREMGLVEGALVKVIDKPIIGPIIVEVNGTKIALGRGMAKKVIVEPVRLSPG